MIGRGKTILANEKRVAMVLLAIGIGFFLLLGTRTALAGVDDGDYGNYLNNGSFDSGMAYWQGTETATWVASCTDSREGCLRIHPLNFCNSCSDYAEQWVYVPEGGIFTASVDVYGNWYHHSRLRVYDVTGNLKLDRVTVAANGWTTLSGSFSASPGNYRVVLAVTKDVWGEKTSYFDNATVTVNGEGPPFVPLIDRMVWSTEPECPLCSAQDAVGWAGGSINTRNGNLSYQETDLSIPVQGSVLEFRRSYASQAVDIYTRTMGHGWTHNYDMRLHFEGNLLPDTVELQAVGGSRLPFFDNGDGTYSPYAGVTAQLAEVGATYVVTTFNQMVYTFDHQGLLLQQEDAKGNVITFTHNAQGRLIEAAQGERSLTYDYDATTEYLTSVTDNAGRSVALDYNGNGDLTVVTGTLGVASTYHYSGTTHLLSEVVDPAGVTVEKTAYNDEGHAYRQWDGANNLLVDISFAITNTHVVTENGVVMTHTYDSRGTLIDSTFSCADGTTGCGNGTGKAYDGNFKAKQVVDANGNPTSLGWDMGGSNLESVTDALNNTTNMVYDGLNNLTQVVNAREMTTTYAYDNASFPTFRTSMTDALGNTTIYTPTVSGLLGAEQDPNGSVTTYDYNSFGQVVQVVQAAGTSEAITTTYGYDAAGRLQTTTETSAGESHTTLNVYDDGNRLIATIANWTGSDPSLWQDDCDTSQGPRDENICTRYEYDAAGRIISTTNTLGQTNLTFYDSAGRMVAAATNWDGSPYSDYNDLCNFADPDAEHNICNLTGYDDAGRVISATNPLGQVTRTFYDSLGRVAGMVENSQSVTSLEQCAFPPAAPDRDQCTLYEYDAAGNTIIVTDSVGRMTRTFYDPLNRVAGTIENWSGTITQMADLPNCLALPAARDNDICTLYAYDEVGNTIIVTDTVGHMTRTLYDELNRVEGVVQNWQPGFTLENCFDSGLDPHRDENICTLYEYDAAGNQTTVTDAKGQKSHAVYDSANRPVVQVQNWDGVTPIETDGTGCADTTTNPNGEVNLCSFTVYDALGRRASTVDVLGHITEFAYDSLGRVVTTTRYLNGQPVQTTTSYDALGNRLAETDTNGHTTNYSYDSLNRLVLTTSQEGVTTSQTYNAAGWVLSTVDGLAHTTTNSYDDLGRLISTTDAENNTTQYEYDAAGNQRAMIDAEGVRTSYGYDGLNRLTSVVENDTSGVQTDDSNLLTQYAYDALGNRTVITNARGFTVTHTLYDALNRPVTVYDALGNATAYSYDLLGNRTVMTDANGAVTNHSYDNLNRLITTTYTADGVTVSYQYDAAGNRVQMVDDVGITTYVYDDFQRLITVTNPFNAVVGYRYDDAGNRTQLIYPDSRSVGYTYDGDNRLVEVADWNSGVTTYQYDDAGRLITTTLPNGVVSLNGYDDANRLLSLRHEDTDGGVLAEYLYTLDSVGNRVAVTETKPVSGFHQLLTETAVTTGSNNENWPALAYNSSDNEYLVVWQDEDTSPTSIFGRRLDADGNVLGSSFLLANGVSADVAYSVDDNSYLVVWDQGTAVWARPVSADGTPGTAFKIYDGSNFANVQAHPAVTYNPTSVRFLVTWKTMQLFTPYSIIARSISIDGQQMGNVIAVARAASPQRESVIPASSPRVAVDDTGNYLIVWQDERSGNNGPAIYGQRLSDTALIGDNFVVRDMAAEEMRPDVAWNNESETYLIVWQYDEKAIWGQRVDRHGNLSGDAIQFSSWDSSYPRATSVGEGWLVAWGVSGSGPGGPVSYVAGREVAGDGSLPGTELLLSSSLDEVAGVAVAGNEDYLVAWAGRADSGGIGAFTSANLNIYSRIARYTTQLHTVITYTYDPLYRLTGAVYNNGLTADYSYVYDAVGNMTAYTETVGTESTHVVRTFDAANRLQTALDLDEGTTSYHYDDNGNLTVVYPPGSDAQNPVEVLRYAYDQRNMLVSHETNPEGTGWVLQAEYAYDGGSDRLRQVDYTGATPITTTYTNDIFGLTQVLVADDGTSQVTNLFGLDLISQDDGNEVRTLLVDGLGSVRTEMVDEVVETVTTYSPYGEVLEQTGTSRTEYGFTGEQEDGSTGLLYLRARYYSPALKVFQSPDPWEGTGWRPETLNYYGYTYGNPINLVDRVGLCAEDPYDPYVDYDCWILAKELSDWAGGGYEEFVTWDYEDLLLYARASGFWTERWDTYERFDIALNYMYQEMINNAQSKTVSDIRVWLNLSCEVGAAYAGYPSTVMVNPVGYRIAALGTWATMTCAGCPWDHKGRLDDMLGLGNTPPSGDYFFPIRGDTTYEYYYDVWSNIHFGYVGTAAGFDEETLQSGAALGDFVAGANDAADELSVHIGVELWHNHALLLTPQQLHFAILRRRNEYLSIQAMDDEVQVLIRWTNGK